MGLDDLVDDQSGGGKKTSLKIPDDPDDWRANGEEKYFNKNYTKPRGTIDRVKDSIEVDGEQKDSHTLYIQITSSIKIKKGVIYDDDDDLIVDVSNKDCAITTKQIRVMYGDKSQQKLCYEIRVR